MTDKPTPTEIDDLVYELRQAGKDDTYSLARAVLAKWGTPAGAGEPFGYFHQLLNHEGKGNGVWLGAAERKVVEQAHTPGETSEEIVALYTTPQPTQAQAGAVPTRFTKAQQERLYRNRPQDVGKSMSLADWRRAVEFIEAAHGITKEGGQQCLSSTNTPMKKQSANQ